MARYAQIASTGRYVPAQVRTNAELDALLSEPVDQWLIDNVGIRQRHLIGDDEVTSDLAVHAARQALERAGVAPGDVDLLILATDTPDYVSPGTASVVQYKLGAANAGTFDVNSACAAWVIGLDMAARPSLPTMRTVYPGRAYVPPWTGRTSAPAPSSATGRGRCCCAGERPGFLRNIGPTARSTITWVSSPAGRSRHRQRRRARCSKFAALPAGHEQPGLAAAGARPDGEDQATGERH